ncbi:MAG: EcoRI family type II restriction endonuclease [Polyangia bacterium]
MSHKDELRNQRYGTVINTTSQGMEGRAMRAVARVVAEIEEEFGVRTHHERQWLLNDVVRRLKKHFPDVQFAEAGAKSAMRPDGGILSILDKHDEAYPILIVEVKNQGTNDLRASEGKPRQAQGNAIERLGKNVIGFRTAMLNEAILPFVCFGDGCDFEKGSSILDRVVTINMLGPLNELRVANEGQDQRFNRGSFFFRPEAWTEKEMHTTMLEIARRAVQHYFSVHGDAVFVDAPRKPKQGL